MNLSQDKRTIFILTAEDEGEMVMIDLLDQSPIFRDDNIEAYSVRKITGFSHEFSHNAEIAGDFIKMYKMRGISVTMPSGEIIAPSELESRFKVTAITKTISFDIA